MTQSTTQGIEDYLFYNILHPMAIFGQESCETI
jgi:hypothetical protein